MLARLNARFAETIKSLRYTHLIGLILIIQGLISVDAPAGGTIAYMANTMRISPRLYAYACLACGMWCWARPETKAVLIYLSPLAWYVIVGVMVFLSRASIPAQIFGVMGYAFALVALMFLGVKNSDRPS